jgi:hypothetical protein
MVTYPEMRAAIIDAFKVLSDIEYQRRYWVEGGGQKDGLMENLDANIGVIYNTYGVADDPYSQVGWSLRNAEEARAIQDFDEAYQRFFGQLEDRPYGDDEVISSPGWKDVVRAASRALEVLLSAGDAE